MTNLPRSVAYAVAGAAVIVAAIVAVREPLENTMPVYAQLAQRMRVETVTESFEPLGYAWLMAHSPGEDVDTSSASSSLRPPPSRQRRPRRECRWRCWRH